MSAPKMKIRSVCDGDGKVLFVESRGDFVDLLLHLTKIPVGSLPLLADGTGGAGAVASIQRSARAMSDSMFKDEASLREEAWENDIETGIEDMLGGQREEVKVVTGNAQCGDTAAPYRVTFETDKTWDHGIAFRGTGKCFEVSIEYTDQTPHFMFGILPDDDNLIQRLSQGGSTFRSHGRFLHNQTPDTFLLCPGYSAFSLTNGNGPRQLRMRFERDPRPKLEYSLCGGPWVEVDNPMKHMSDQNAEVCPTILLSPKNGVHSLVVNHVSRRNTSLVPPQIVSSSANFLITNNMEILESGSLHTMLNLMTRFGISDMSQLKMEEVEFGPEELRRMIAALIAGERDLLTSALLGDPTQFQR